MKDLTHGKPARIILYFALPILIGNLFNLAYNLADTRIVGTYLGNDALAAVGSISTLNDLLVGFIVGLANGFAVIMAQHFGSGDKNKSRKVFALSILMGLVVTAIVVAAVDMPGKDSSSHKPAESIEAGQESGKENRTEHIEPVPMAVPEQLSLFSEDRKLLDEKNLADHKIIGQLFDTYWLIEFDQKLFIMDQHAAHEKVLYEHFMKRVSEGTPASQQLMPPQIITLTLAAGQVLKDNMDIIANMGFEIESFGGNEYAIRAVPVELYGASGKDMIMEIIDDLMENPGRVSNETVKSRIATMACKAAVKGNNRLQPAEVRELVTELMTLDNPYNCPHGRPTMISMSKYELEKKFKRIV